MAMVLLYTAPAWVAVFSRILFHESFSSRMGIALGLWPSSERRWCASPAEA